MITKRHEHFLKTKKECALCEWTLPWGHVAQINVGVGHSTTEHYNGTFSCNLATHSWMYNFIYLYIDPFLHGLFQWYTFPKSPPHATVPPQTDSLFAAKQPEISDSLQRFSARGWLTTRWSSHINVCKVKVTQQQKKAWPTVVASLILVACLVGEIIQHLLFSISGHTMTLHQGQGHRNEHGHICHILVFRRAKFECNSLNNCPRYCTLKSCQLWDALVSLNGGQCHGTGNGMFMGQLSS